MGAPSVSPTRMLDCTIFREQLTQYFERKGRVPLVPDQRRMRRGESRGQGHQARRVRSVRHRLGRRRAQIFLTTKIASYLRLFLLSLDTSLSNRHFLTERRLLDHERVVSGSLSR